MSEFYQKVLGFRVPTGWRTSLRSRAAGPDHHTVNFLDRQENPDASHRVRGEGFCPDLECLRAARAEVDPDHLGAAAPRSRPERLHLSPQPRLATSLEFYIELDQMKDEELGYFEPRPWHHDAPQRPKVRRGRIRDRSGGPPPTEAYFRNTA